MLNFTKIKLKSNDLGFESLVPDFKGGGSVPNFKYKNGFTPDMLQGFNQGMVEGVLPYTLQNGFDRDFKVREYDAVVLENDYLKATFLVGLGGRLWSLYDKKQKKDLIYENDALIFSNLALRKAWFAGGVEWNIGIRGHSVFTCDKVFAVAEKTEDGNDVLKMYEYEVLRGLIFVMRFILIENKLVCKFEIENVSDKDTYCYWWSNIAAELTPSTRVVVPAEKTYLAYYSDGYHVLTYENVPVVDGIDTSFSFENKVTADYFYHLGDGKKWLYCLDDSNYGLLQYSSRNTLGKKQFVWGHKQGGEHWNEWLTDGRPYIEVQSGILQTQFQHFILPKNNSLTFYEVYTGYSLKQNQFNSNYSSIVSEVEGVVNENYITDKYFSNLTQVEVLYLGSGKGAIAQTFRNKPLTDKCEFYANSLTQKDKYYIDLYNGKTSGDYEISYSNDAYVFNKMKQKRCKNDADYYFAGVTAIALKDYEYAVKMLEKVGISKYYSLANITLGIYYSKVANDTLKGYKHGLKAIKDCNDLNILLQFCELCILNKRYNECAEFIKKNKLDDRLGRFKLYLLTCYEKLDMLEDALAIINSELIIPDMREGEYSIYSVYLDIHKKVLARKTGRTDITSQEIDALYPIRKELDFRLD